jgi:hypothetical protein
MEPPDCNSDDDFIECEHCYEQAEDDGPLCASCQQEADEMSGVGAEAHEPQPA